MQHDGNRAARVVPPRAYARIFLRILALLAVLALPAAAQTFSFSTVRVTGNQNVDAGTVLSFAGIRRGETLTAADVNDAVQRVRASGLFMTVEAVPQGSTLVIQVRENPTINEIAFQGNRRLKDEVLQGIVKSEARRVYSAAQAEADATAISEAYAGAGRFVASVTPKIIERQGNRIDLVFEIREGRVVEVERLSFVGNRSFSERRLRSVLTTKQAGLLRTFIQRDTFDPGRVAFDERALTDFYQSRGFIDMQVLSANTQVSRERNAFFITFTIREGLRYTFNSVRAVSEYPGVDAADFQRAIRVRPGATYSPVAIENTIARLETLAGQKGITFARVEPRITRNPQSQTLDVAFAITRGPRVFVERIDIEGNSTTLDRVIRRQFRTVEGDPFNPREIRAAAERIKALGFFKDSSVTTQEGTSPDQAIVNVNVEEQPTGSLTFGVSYGVSQGVGFQIGFAEQNFLGRGQYLAVSLNTTRDSGTSSVTFVEPAFLDRDLRFRFSAFYTTQRSNFSFYDTKTVGVTPSIEFPISALSRLELRYRIANDTLSSVDFNSSIILKRDEGTLLTSAVGYTLSYDTRRSGLNPNAGVLLRFGQDFAGVGGDRTYVQTTALLSAETKIRKEEVTLRAELEGGAVNATDGVSRITDRSFLNGKIRGFEPNGIGPRDLATPNSDALGGNYYAVLRLESEFPIGIPEEYGVSGGLFLDAGSVWSLDDTAGGLTGSNTVDDSFHLRSSIGVSVFWTTPIGPLRFNFSKALVKQDYDETRAFDLTISSRF